MIKIYKILFILIGLGAAGFVWADPEPPIPIIPTEVSEVMPPPDTGTPVPIPSDEELRRSLGEKSTDQGNVPTPTDIPVSIEPTSTPNVSLGLLPTFTATPLPLEPTSTPSLFITVLPSPSPTPILTPLETPAVTIALTQQVAPSVAVPTGGLYDYFPVVPGQKVEFAYLKAEKGEAAPHHFTVQCENFTVTLNGTTQVAFENSESGSPVTEQYLMTSTEVEQNSTTNRNQSDDFILKLPGSTEPAVWKQTDVQLTRIFKAALGSATVLRTNYPDCVIVEEKDMKSGKKIGSVYRYYAKGIGLISLETYSADLKLIQTKSFVLTSVPK
jgi:hypothetical protein